MLDKSWIVNCFHRVANGSKTDESSFLYIWETAVDNVKVSSLQWLK